MKKTAFILFIFIFQFATLTAKPTIKPSALCQQAYEQILSLQLSEGRNLAQTALSKDPNNYLPYWILDYADCLELIINGNPGQYTQYKSNRDKRLRLLDECESNNPYLNFVNASINFRWAGVHFRFGEQWNAMLLFRKAYQQIKENYKKDPQFGPHKMLMGFTMAIAGTVPEDYNWLTNILGMSGNINKGVGLVDAYLNDDSQPIFNLHQEALIYQLYLKFYLQRNETWTWNQVTSGNFGEGNNYFEKLIKANIALNFRKGTYALNTLESVPIAIRNKFPAFWYELAQAQQNKLNSQAINSYQNFIYLNRGKWYFKDAWMQIALIHYSNNNRAAAQTALSKIKLNGNQVLDPDKKAHRFSIESKWPNIELYKAHSLTDGGYYQEALQILTRITSVKNIQEKTEWSFRLARVYDEMGRDAEALKFYNQAYELGKLDKEQYAARAALLIAKNYETRTQKELALQWYQKCLAMRNHDFQTSIDNQAKAGISRTSGK